MSKYFEFEVYGYSLYFTSHCIIEAFHVHASDKHLTEHGSAKFYVYEDGSTKVVNKGRLSAKRIRQLQDFIKENHQYMYQKWLYGGGKPEYKKRLMGLRKRFQAQFLYRKGIGLF